MFEPYYNLFQSSNFLLTFKVLYYSSFIWIPSFTVYLVWELWLRYVRAVFMASQTYIVLEVKIPREVFKSPRAAEFFITGLSSGFGEGNWYEKYWKGGLRAWTSLEIVSIEGSVHFFIWTRKGSKNSIESNLYSQYPGIEIFEVPDYTLPLIYNSETHSMWSTEFDLTKADAFPIKTYIDYGLDKDPKEEYKIDPITPILESLGTLGRGQIAGIQIIVRQHKAEDKDPVTKKMIDARWAKAAEKEIEDIIKKAKGDKGPDDKIVPGTGRQLTDTEKETINALGRSVSKPGFDVGIRGLYFAEKDAFNSAVIGGVISGVTHFNSSLNGFKPARGHAENRKWLIWMKRSPEKINGEKQHLLDAYKRRAYFHKPFKSPHFVLNAEELATMYHFPGQVSTTPTFGRIDSRKGEAPSNLPV